MCQDFCEPGFGDRITRMQPAVSEEIHIIESELGIAIGERISRSMLARVSYALT